MNQDSQPQYPIEEEFYFSMSRDVSDKERGRKSVYWWEIPLYLGLLAFMFSISATLIK